MAPVKALLALTTRDNDYQRAQASSAEAAARRLGVELQVVYAEGDAVLQIEQILTAVQARNHDINIVITQPVGTGMVNVAEQAAKSGIAWAILSREVDYLTRLRSAYNVPVFEVSVDQIEIGHIQAQQVATVLPNGGTALYLTGPASGSSARLRADGFNAKKPANVELKLLRGNWTDDSGYRAVNSWLKLSTSKSTGFSAIISQNDAMVVGARRAFNEVNDANERDAWLHMPMIGCDGLPETGQQYVRRGLLTATVATPPIAAMALELYVQHRQAGTPVPERTLASSSSFPDMATLQQKAAALAK